MAWSLESYKSPLNDERKALVSSAGSGFQSSSVCLYILVCPLLLWVPTALILSDTSSAIIYIYYACNSETTTESQHSNAGTIILLINNKKGSKIHTHISGSSCQLTSVFAGLAWLHLTFLMC